MRTIKNLLIFTLLVITTLLNAQNRPQLTGSVTDETGKILPFITIAVVSQPDGRAVTGSVSSDAGTFAIQLPAAGTYLLRLSATGYRAFETPVFEITADAIGKDFGALVLSPDMTQLAEVKVESLRPQITQDADKMTVRVDGTAMASGNNAFTVLSRMPGVFVDPEGNIQLNGKGGVTVMIDGKLTYLSAADLRNMLEGMAAENIKSIEIITNPSAKYDAEGTSGILNINLKKNTRTGMNGSLYSGYTYNFKQHAYTYGGNINYKSGKWNTFLSLDAARRAGGREATFTRVFHAPEGSTYFDQTATGNYRNNGPPIIRVGADYSLSEKQTLGVTAGLTTNMLHHDFLTDTYISDSPGHPMQYIDSDNYNKNRYTNYKTNVHYAAAIDTLGTSFSADLDYVKIRNRGSSNFYNYFTALETGERTGDFLYTTTPNDFNIYSAKADYVKALGKHKLESGLKTSRVVSDNDSRFYFNNGALVPDLSRTNHFVFAENIYAGYLSWNGPLSKKLTAKAGLRLEDTENKGTSLTTGQQTKRSYLNLFPSLFVQHHVSDNYEISYSYSRRITRPNYGTLNPFRSYRDPYTWVEGNPMLRPQFTHSFSIGQVFHKIYHLNIGFDYDKDVMSELPILDVTNHTTIYTTGNVDHGKTAELTALIPFKIAKWWDSQNTLVSTYNIFSMQSQFGLLENKQLSYTLQSNHTLKLPGDLRFEMNLQYHGPSAYGLYHMAANHRVDVALKKSFFGKKVDVTLKANDLFKGFRYVWTTDIAGNVNEFDQYFRIRNVGLSLRYNFSKGQKVEGARNGTVEELNRL
jgi:hypothetical protein